MSCRVQNLPPSVLTVTEVVPHPQGAHWPRKAAVVPAAVTANGPA